MKGFYRQKKKTPIGGGVAKPSAAAFKKKAAGASLKGSSTSSVEGDVAPPPAVVFHDSFDLGGKALAYLAAERDFLRFHLGHNSPVRYSVRFFRPQNRSE